MNWTVKASNRASSEGSHVYNSHPTGDLIICFIYCRATLVPTHQTMGSNQRHILRDRRPGTTACPGLEKPRHDKISCTGTTSPTNQPRKDPFHLYSINPHSPQFQQAEGATPLWSLWKQHRQEAGDADQYNILYICQYTGSVPRLSLCGTL
jgi:hypothetical protein